VKQTELHLWQVTTWCIRPKATAAFVEHMEDVVRLSHRPSARPSPVVCMDEASKQLIGAVNAPLPLPSGAVNCEDYA
jgi:hypothetical protein